MDKLDVVAARSRGRVEEAIGVKVAAGNVLIPVSDLTLLLNALDMQDQVLPPAMLRMARACMLNVNETRRAIAAVEASASERRDGSAARQIVQEAQRWSTRTVDAAAELVDAVLAYEHTGARGAASGVTAGAAHVESTMDDGKRDAPLSEDVLELNREAQKAVDREVAARTELDAAIANRIDVRAKIGKGSAAAIAFIDAYANPTIKNPDAPVAPDVAVPAPQVEPPVFTTVDTPTITPDNTSGGEPPAVAAVFEVEDFEEPVQPPAEPDTSAPPKGSDDDIG